MNSTTPVVPAANKSKPSFLQSLFGAKPNAAAPSAAPAVGGRRKNRASRKDRKNRNAMSRKNRNAMSRKNRNAMSRKNRNAMSRRNRH